MTPFYTRFPELAAHETRVARVMTGDASLPFGEYGFVEYYCDDPGCDCRRVLILVCTPQVPDSALATINYGWESAEFYTRWMHGDEKAGREITSASLDPLHPQSEFAEALLEIFRREIAEDPAYVARLARHYEMFKATQNDGARPPAQAGEVRAESPLATPMTIPEILALFQRVPDRAEFAPYERAMRAAAEHRDAIVPELIASIDRVSANPALYRTNSEDCLHCFAIYLLAQFREPRALDCFLRFFSLPGEDALNLTGDMVTEHGAAILASVCNGDPAPLLALIKNESVNSFVRTQAIDGLVVQALWGERSREDVVEELRRLFNTLPKPGSDHVWAGLASVICDFHATELAEEGRRAFEEGLVDEDVLDLDFFEESLSGDDEFHTDGFRERNVPIDAINEIAAWLCFHEDDDEVDEPFDDDTGWIPTPYASRRDTETIPGRMPYLAPPKVGRNDPCPCGSGKKFKKCCGN
jgi:hypothetical protein